MIVAKDFRFEAAHSLDHLPAEHPCSRTHGHSYRIVVYVRGLCDPDMAWVMDYAEIGKIVRELVVDVLDHRNLNEFITPSTAENLAEWIWCRVAPAIRFANERASLWRIDVHETESTVVIYEGGAA